MKLNLRKLIYTGLFIACSFAQITYAAAPPPIQVWTARFNGTHDSTDIAKAIAVDNQGNVYVTGYSWSLLVLTDIVTIKYDPNGNELWRTYYQGILDDGGNAIALDDNNDVYVAGYTNVLLNNLLGDYIVIKYSGVTGIQQWAYIYDGTAHGQDIAYSLVVDNLHNTYVTGSSTNNGIVLGNIDYTTIKLNSSGQQQWIANYDGPAHSEDIAYKIVKDGLGNVIVTGSSRSALLAGSEDYATVKYNSNGAQQWAARYDGPAHNQDIAYDLAVDRSNNIIVTGTSTGNGSGLDYATIKYSPAGNQQWAARYNGTGNGEDRAYAIVVDNSDNPIVTGETAGSSTGQDYGTVKYDPSGNQQWAAIYNNSGSGNDRAYAIVVDNSNNVFVTGGSDSPSTGQDYGTVKYDPSGNQQWAIRYNGPGNNEDRAYAIVVDNSNNVYVTGESRHSSITGSEDYLTIKYSDSFGPKGINIISGIVPQKFNLYQNFPNPFNPATLIKFDISHPSFVHLVIYDILGNKVNDVVDQNMKPGTYETSVNADNIPSGIYFYRLIADGYIESKKMILLK